MKKRLLLITHGYPFGESERGFLGEEAKVLAAQFDLVIMALDNADPLIYPTDGILHIERYRYSSFRKTRQFRALPSVFAWDSWQEAWAMAKAQRFSNPLGNLRHILYYRFNVWEMEQQIEKLVRSHQIDLVYTYWCNECTVAAVQLKKRYPHLKVVTRFHGMDLYQHRAADNWQPFRSLVARRADGLCFACSYAHSYFLQHWGTKAADKMHLCYLGSTDRGQIALPEADTLCLVSCSNVIALKRIDLIIEALALLPESVKVQWHHFGDGISRKELEALAAERLGDRSNVQWTFHGFVPNGALTGEYKKLKPHLFITTSSTEGGAPVSIQEAFSMGIPAIGTPVGGIPDLIADGKTGFLLPEQAQPADLARAIVQYGQLPDCAKADLASAARNAWKQKFDARENAARFTAYLRNLIIE